MQIPILIEPEYERSSWTEIVMNGIRSEAVKLKYKTCVLDASHYAELDWDAVFGKGERMVLVVAPSMSWAPKILPFFEERDISVILIVFDPSEGTTVRGLVRMDYVHATKQLLQYLHGCGRSRIALYGVNPTYFVDNLKVDSFKEWNAENEKHIYPAYASLSACFDSFLPRVHSYDAVVCSNALTAVSLMKHLQQSGVRVPEDVYVASFGSNRLSNNIRPSVTCVTLDYEEVGRQSVRLYSWLFRQKPCSNVSVRVRTQLVIRESTAMQQPSVSERPQITPSSSPISRDVYMYCDQEAQILQAVGNILNVCDETDAQLMRGLIDNQTNSLLEEKLFLSSYALRYRIKRLMSLAHCEYRQELVDFLRANWEMIGGETEKE